MKTLPVAVVGAGPIGLAAAVHLLEAGETPLVLEAGDRAGHSIRVWGHVRMFSQWRFNTDRSAVALLEANGWVHPPADETPTGREYVEKYLQPLSATSVLRNNIRFGARVIAVGRKGFDKKRTTGRSEQPFVVRVRERDGIERSFEAKAVIDASGTWTSPNPIGAGGVPATGEAEAADRIFYGIPDVLGHDQRRYADRTVAVVGSGHSAINALLDLAELRYSAPRTRIVWVSRSADIASAYGGGEADQLEARGALGVRMRRLVESGAVTVVSPFRIERVERQGGRIGLVDSAGQRIEADEIIGATGFRPDLSFLREVRLATDPWLESAGELAPLIDPNIHSCGTVRPHGYKELRHPEENFYIAGMKSYGRAPTFLAATGHEQVRSIVAALSGDLEAANRVELVLPETGVCSAPSAAPSEAQGCCGGPAPAGVDACCVADADAKQAGEGGCGCGEAKAKHARVKVTVKSSCCGG